MNLSHWFLKHKGHETCGDHLQDLFHLESLLKMKEAFSIRLRDYPLQNMEFGCEMNENVEGTFEYFQEFSAIFDKFMSFMDNSLQSVEKRASGHLILQERIVTLFGFIDPFRFE